MPERTHQLLQSSPEASPAPAQRVADSLAIASRAEIRSIYLHVPFCFHKCHYCDFYSIVDSHDRQAAFTQRLIAELRHVSPRLRLPLVSIFIGGGTPTLLNVKHWHTLLAAMHDALQIDSQACEFTVEANPETVTAELADTLAEGGINRISIGCQSFNRDHLKTLERWHDPENVSRAVSLFRNAGMKRISLDLIFGIPGQSLADWLLDLETALALQPQHLSCYALTYELGTAMTEKLRLGRIERIDEDLELAMYEAAIERLAHAGFEHYEISNWAQPSEQCQHNLAYWTSRNWWAFGPSASGHVDGVRWKNVPRLSEYLLHGPSPRVTDVEQLAANARIGETLMMYLRLTDGIPEQSLAALLADDLAGRTGVIEREVQAGRLIWRDGTLRLTDSGRRVADSVLAGLL
ncbi:MAG: radical SAM family heme chaperone HemW [Phycisphaerales bacterium]